MLPRSPRPVRRHLPPGRCPSSTGRGRFASFAEQLVEPAGLVESDQIVAASDMVLADEYLRDRGSALGALDHDLFRFSAKVHGDFIILDALGIENRLGSPAIWAKCLGIDLDGHARSLNHGYLGIRLNASTAKVSPRGPS